MVDAVDVVKQHILNLLLLLQPRHRDRGHPLLLGHVGLVAGFSRAQVTSQLFFGLYIAIHANNAHSLLSAVLEKYVM